MEQVKYDRIISEITNKEKIKELDGTFSLDNIIVPLKDTPVVCAVYNKEEKNMQLTEIKNNVETPKFVTREDDNALIIRVDLKKYYSMMTKVFVAGLFIGFLITMTVLFFVKMDLTVQAKAIMENVKVENSALVTEISTRDKRINDLNYEKSELNKLVAIKDKEIEKNMGELNILRGRKELYDKYSYVITVGGNRTEIDYSTIELGEKLMKEKGINPHMLFGLIRLESAGNPKTTNSRSSARGLGQFLKGSGRWVYEDLLGHGKNTYNHDMAFDQKTNIKMSVAYLDYLMRTQNGDARLALRLYNGNELGDRYISIIDSYIAPKGITVSGITRQYRGRS